MLEWVTESTDMAENGEPPRQPARMWGYHAFFAAILSLVALAFAAIVFSEDFLRLTGRLQRESSTAANRSTPASQPSAVFVLQAVHLISPSGCLVAVYLTNGSNQVVNQFMGDIVIQTPSGARETSRYSFSYVDAGRSGEAQIRFSASCDDRPAAIEFRRIEICEVGGTYYRDCGRYVRVSPHAGGIPVHDYVNR